jgi:hypothetical protein
MKKKLAVAALCAIAALAAADAARAQGERYLQAPVGLPSGPNGLGTAVYFLGPCPRGVFSGVVIERMIPEAQRIRIQEQWGTGPLGRILYDGPIAPGQFIPFTHVRVVWTGWKGGYGNNMNGIVVRGVCLARTGATPPPGTPPAPSAADDQFCRDLFARADAENRAGNLARDRGDLAGARARYEQARALFRQGAADPRCARFQGQFANAAGTVERNIQRVVQDQSSRAADDRYCQDLYARGDAENRSGNTARDRGDLVAARGFYRQALDVFRRGAADRRCARFQSQFANAAAIAERNMARAGQAPVGPRRVFNNPMVNGVIVDHCVNWGTNCGLVGASNYCRRMGMSRAVSFNTFSPGRTWVMGDNKLCQGSYCRGFSQIVCE